MDSDSSSSSSSTTRNVMQLYQKQFISKINYFKLSRTDIDSSSLDLESRTNLYIPSRVLDSRTIVDSERFESSDEEFENESDDSERSWPDTELPGSWGLNALEEIPWNDDDKPVVRFQIDLQNLTEEEENGLLTDRIIASCSSYLDRCPTTGSYVLCKCDLNNLNLSDITLLAYHNYLQYVNLSHNRLTKIDALAQLPYLMYLDVSFNNLKDVLTFKPPFYLTYVDYSYNEVDEIGDLSGFWSIVNLNLSYNSIRVIQGLENLKYLRYLDLSNNSITKFENLNNMNLLTLNLNNNMIEETEEGDNVGLKTLRNLLKLRMSNNQLSSLKFFEGAKSIQSIYMMSNLLEDITEMYHLRSLLSLSELDLRHNALSTSKHYFAICVYILPCLLYLDGDMVEPHNKIQALAKFKPHKYNLASMKIGTLLTLANQLNHPTITSAIIPVGELPPRIIVFVGPAASNKGHFVNTLYEHKSKHLELGVSHTTRNQVEGEIDGYTYHFIAHEEFHNLIKSGEMLTYKRMLGHFFGITRNELCKVSNSRKMLVFHTDMKSALILRTLGYQPFLILSLPGNAETHKKWLTEKYTTYHSENDSSFLYIIRGTAPRPESKTNFPEEEEEEVGEEYVMAEEHPNTMDLDSITESKSFKSVSDSTSFFEDSKYDMNRDNRKSVSTYSSYSATISDNSSSQKLSKLLKNPSDKSSVTFGTVREVYPQVEDTESKEQTSEAAEESVTEESTFIDQQFIGAGPDEDIFTSREEYDISNISTFYYDVISKRKSYLNFVNNNVGIFINSIFTDEPEKSMKKVLKLLGEIYMTKAPPLKTFQIEDDPGFDSFLGERLRNFKLEMLSAHPPGDSEDYHSTEFAVPPKKKQTK